MCQLGFAIWFVVLVRQHVLVAAADHSVKGESWEDSWAADNDYGDEGSDHGPEMTAIVKNHLTEAVSLVNEYGETLVVIPPMSEGTVTAPQDMKLQARGSDETVPMGAWFTVGDARSTQTGVAAAQGHLPEIDTQQAAQPGRAAGGGAGLDQGVGSPTTSSEVKVTFMNAVDVELFLFWQDPESKREIRLERMAPGDTMSFDSFAGHEWVFRSASSTKSKKIGKVLLRDVPDQFVTIDRLPGGSDADDLAEPESDGCKDDGADSGPDKVLIHFENEHPSMPLRIFWLDGATERYVMELAPEGKQSMSSYPEHTWIFKAPLDWGGGECKRFQTFEEGTKYSWGAGDGTCGGPQQPALSPLAADAMDYDDSDFELAHDVF